VSPEEYTDDVVDHAGIDNTRQPLQSLPIDFVRTTTSIFTPLQDTSNSIDDENNKSDDENDKENVIPTSASTTRLDTVCNKRLLERLSSITTTTTATTTSATLEAGTKRQRTTNLSELLGVQKEEYTDLSLTLGPIKSTLMALQRGCEPETRKSKNSDRVLLQHPTILPMVPPGFLKCSPICLARLKLDAQNHTRHATTVWHRDCERLSRHLQR
jgi:hypothetical protein